MLPAASARQLLMLHMQISMPSNLGQARTSQASQHQLRTGFASEGTGVLQSALPRLSPNWCMNPSHTAFGQPLLIARLELRVHRLAASRLGLWRYRSGIALTILVSWAAAPSFGNPSRHIRVGVGRELRTRAWKTDALPLYSKQQVQGLRQMQYSQA